MYQWDFGILWSYRWLFLNGLGVTVGFTVVIVVLGLVFGLFGAFGSLSRLKAVRLVALTFIEAFRCTPILVQLIWFYYALPFASRTAGPPSVTDPASRPNQSSSNSARHASSRRRPHCVPMRLSHDNSGWRYQSLPKSPGSTSTSRPSPLGTPAP